MKLYGLLTRILTPFAVIGYYAYGYIFRSSRTRIVVKDQAGRVVLVRTWLGGNKWGLPGGGVNKNERYEDAALRELREETSIEALPEDLGEPFKVRHAGHNEVVFDLVVDTDLELEPESKYEIREVAWFSVDELPALDKLSVKVLGGIRKSTK